MTGAIENSPQNTLMGLLLELREIMIHYAMDNLMGCFVEVVEKRI